MKRFVLFLSVLALVLPLFSFAGCAGGEVPRSKYDISAEYEGGVLTAEMAFTYHNAEECEMPALEFNLYGNAYREGAVYAPVSPAFRASAYYNGESWGEMNVLSVTPCAAWERRSRPFPAPTAPRRTITAAVTAIWASRKFPPARRGRCAGRTKISCASSLKSLCRPAGKRRSRSNIL